VLPSSAIAKAIGYAIAQLSDVDVNQIVVRTTSQKW
jgi:NADP-dependent 3-hydroxy acid dehydrogenase YdfG